MSLHSSGKHGTAADKDRGNVHSCCRHQKSRHILIAVGNHHKPVKAVCQSHGLGGVGDQITGNQRILHSGMSHGNTVANGDGREDDGCTAGHGHTQLYGLHDLVQIHMSRNDFVVRADDADKGFCLFFLGQSQGMKQTAVGSIFYTVNYIFFRHKGTSDQLLMSLSSSLQL